MLPSNSNHGICLYEYCIYLILLSIMSACWTYNSFANVNLSTISYPQLVLWQVIGPFKSLSALYIVCNKANGTIMHAFTLHMLLPLTRVLHVLFPQSMYLSPPFRVQACIVQYNAWCDDHKKWWVRLHSSIGVYSEASNCTYTLFGVLDS